MRTVFGIVLCSSIFAIGCGDNSNLERQVNGLSAQIDDLSTQNQQVSGNLTKNQKSIVGFKKDVFDEVRKKHKELLAENLDLLRGVNLARKEIKDLQTKLEEADMTRLEVKDNADKTKVLEKELKSATEKTKALEKDLAKLRIRLFGRRN